ncbi:hypothetical protein [Photorhabdus luminescens]|uniref:Uncharacterized protein n=1 Tax=Photorhabdus luminescens subsp. mexicana TaxID=2100167 RepID=A0A4R4J357_PHOLU|nr:hypothetical protein [Photorhabdus luminescens]TDB47927.1 hypothetical protein C5468_17795 [Photorhabdus luminescens subsp. mexicana]
MTNTKNHADPVFYTGAVWAASVLLRQTGNSDGAREILDHIPQLDRVAALSCEEDLFHLRQFVDKTLPLGKNAQYTKFGVAPLDQLGRVIAIQDTELENYTAPEEGVLFWCVCATDEHGNQHVLIDRLDYLEEAQKLAKTLSQ